MRHVFGKRTVTLHIKVSEETAELLRQRAAAADKSLSDAGATILEINLHGLHTVKNIQAEQLEIVSGIGQASNR